MNLKLSITCSLQTKGKILALHVGGCDGRPVTFAFKTFDYAHTLQT
jgi:hypothetical protein